jgi:CBS domain-containing membrane protein
VTHIGALPVFCSVTTPDRPGWRLKFSSFAESLRFQSIGNIQLQFLRTLGPAVTGTTPMEAVRASLGAFIGLWLTGFFLLSPGVDLDYGLYFVAPLGASAVLLFAVPNSPLAQPWPAVVGNTVVALVGVAISLFVHEPTLRIAPSLLRLSRHSCCERCIRRQEQSR